MTRTNLGEIISKFLQGKRLVNFELIRPSFYAEHRAWFCIPKQNCQLYPEVEIGMIITWDVIYTESVSEVTDEWCIDQERKRGNIKPAGTESPIDSWVKVELTWESFETLFTIDLFQRWLMDEVFPQEGKRRRIQWWRSGLSEISVNFDVRGLCIGDPRLTLSRLCFRRL